MEQYDAALNALEVEVDALKAEEDAVLIEKARLKESISAAGRVERLATASFEGALDPKTIPVPGPYQRKVMFPIIGIEYPSPDEPGEEAESALRPEAPMIETTAAAAVHAVPPQQTKQGSAQVVGDHVGDCSGCTFPCEAAFGAAGLQGASGRWALEESDEVQLAGLDFTNECCWTFEPMMA